MPLERLDPNCLDSAHVQYPPMLNEFVDKRLVACEQAVVDIDIGSVNRDASLRNKKHIAKRVLIFSALDAEIISALYLSACVAAIDILIFTFGRLRHGLPTEFSKYVRQARELTMAGFPKRRAG